jgi:hypothetical protein
MKPMWFHLMPYTEPPADFRDSNPSVWVDIHSSLFDPRRAHLMYNEFMDELEYATEAGFDAIARDMEAIVEKGYVIIGAPGEIAEQLPEVATQLNVGHLMLLPQYGNMSKASTRYNTRLFAKQVMPKLKDIHAGWTGHWWPAPMDRSQRAGIPAYMPRLAAE